jgi:hypothetical protein
VQRYEVFHLPALFVIRDGEFHGAIRAPLIQGELNVSVRRALNETPDDLP